MRDDLIAAVRARGGLITRTEALHQVPRHVIEKALNAGVITRAFPAVYALAEYETDDTLLDRAAVLHIPHSGISHTAALRVHNVPHDPLIAARHVTTGPRSHVRATNGLIVHRQRTFDVSTMTVVRRGIRVVRVEQAIVSSWQLLVPSERRKPAIAAVSARQTTADRLLVTLSATSTGAQEMRAFFELLAAGCRSEFELWGHSQVFAVPTLPVATLQHSVQTAAGRFILDRGYREELVGVELDGAAWHGSAAQRERDVRRDAALAAAGWLIVRFTHRRLTSDPAGCREELRQILAARRHQLGLR